MNNEEYIRKNNEFIREFPGNKRFGLPDNMARVTAGGGGETFLIFGENKTVQYDCGMAYCHEQLIRNIKKELAAKDREKVDILLASHSHYDHIGALPYLLKEWPDMEVAASEKTRQVFASEGARKTMKRLGEAARDNFAPGSSEPVLVKGLRVDRVVREGDAINIGGGQRFVVLETKGHTDCSLTYVLEPDKIMFLSESTGIVRSPDFMHVQYLKSYRDTIESARKCKAYGAKRLIVPHYGILPEYFTNDFFDMYVRFAEDEKNFILGCRDQGMDREQIFSAFTDRYWSEERSRHQPKAAYEENARISIDLILKEFQ